MQPRSIALAPRNLDEWVRQIDPADLPILDESAAIIAQLSAREDDVDAHLLASELGGDPLFVLKLLAHVSALRNARSSAVAGGAETAVEALVMLGIPPFFKAFNAAATISIWLSDPTSPAARGFDRVLRRSHRAARFAIAFAAHRLDHDAAILGEAALLHDFAELLLWLYAPALALEIRRRQVEHPDLRSAQLQREILNVELPDLQHALLKRWQLPEFLVHITGKHLRDTAQVQNVQLAIRVARHSALGWDNAAIPDDIRDVASLLNIGIDPTWRLLREIDVD